MRVDEPRRDHLAGGVDDPGGSERRLDLGSGAHRRDHPVAHGDSGVVEHARRNVKIKDPATGDQQIAGRPRAAARCPVRHRIIVTAQHREPSPAGMST